MANFRGTPENHEKRKSLAQQIFYHLQHFSKGLICWNIVVVINVPVAYFWHTVRLVIFVGLIFCGLGISDDFVGLYFRDIPPLIT